MSTLIGFALVILGTLAYGVVPLVYWFFHDALTWMQLFKTLWYLYIGGWVIQFLGYILVKVGK